MSERKPCCQESWGEGWFQGLKNAGELLGFSADSHSSFRAAMDERIADAVQDERAAIVAWLHMQEGRHTFGDLARAIERGEHIGGDDE